MEKSNKIAEFLGSLASIAAGRHYATAILSLFTVIGIFVNIPAQQQAEVIKQLGIISDSMGNIFGALAILVPILTGIGMSLIAVVSGLSATLKGRMKSLDAEAKAGAGIIVLAAEGSKAGEIAASLPGNETQVVSASVPTEVVVPPPAPKDEAKPLTPPVAAIAVLIVASLVLSSCKSAQEYANDALQFIKTVSDGLDKVKDAAKKQCAAVQTVANEAATLALSQPPGKACKAKNVTEGIAASVATACANIDAATITTVVPISRGIIDAYQRAESAKNAGC